MNSEITLIVGLGNPGRKYERTRHNLGFLCVNRLANNYRIRLNKSQSKARTGSGSIEGHRVLLARPQTYMNLSGESVALLLRKSNASPENMIIIHDDLDLPPGRIRVRFGGGSGGHRGIESVFRETGSRDFYRVRIGIGRPPAERINTGNAEDDVIDYVLSNFSPDEKPIVEKSIPVAAEAVVSLITEGLEATMNKYNGNQQ
jgi:PTH1 family peptidyl-tRNA hydrolase